MRKEDASTIVDGSLHKGDLTYDNRGGDVRQIDGSAPVYRSVYRRARRESTVRAL